jgi:hypothetical protein
MMKQRVHEVLDKFAAFKKSSTPKRGAKLPKHANEATRVFSFLALRQRG